MSFMYPRTISILRPTQDTGVGAVGYGGQVPENEQTVATDIAASIQLDRQGRRNRLDLPGDGNETQWNVFIPKSALAKGQVHDLDVVVDDEGARYQVTGAYWNSLGHKLACLRVRV